MMENQINNVQQQVLVPLVGGGNYDATVYCVCQGQMQSDFFVKCDGDDECVNGGWLHPECTNDLKSWSQAELDRMEEWHCEDCVKRIKREEEEEDETGSRKRLSQESQANP